MAYKPIICVDFDGTIVDHDFPRIGKAKSKAFEVLKELKKAGFILVLWTCRENNGHKIKEQYLKDAIEFCKKNGVEFDGHNETPIEHEFRPENVERRKAYGTYYIDDRNLGGFPGWEAVRQIILKGQKPKWHFDKNVKVDDEKRRT